ncbi:MAG: tRNA lysidine(34) synthetase TilS [Saprospiraceae bacterium]|nr:tRNA lysidine(34) synthetase TilS [Saprospiraceae bacterium]
MFDRFLHYNFSLFEGKKIILSCSGGMDSMVLLHLLQQIDCTLIVFHVDHLTRNGQSTQDSHFINQYCKKHSIAFHCIQFCHESGNFQSESRSFRYKGLYQLMEKTKSDYIATAHHMGDNNETFFINAMRGTGLKGLSGMKVIDPPLVRPLLQFRKVEIENYALEHEIPFVQDVSNELNIYVRNIIRNEFLKEVEKLNPNIDKRINHTIEKVSSDYNLLKELIHNIRKKHIHKDRDITIVNLEFLSAFSEGNTLLYHLLQQYGVNLHQVEDIVSSCIGSTFNTPDYIINLDRGKLLIKQKSDETYTDLVIPQEGTFLINKGIQIVITSCDSTQYNQKEGYITLSPTKVKFPLRLRTWLPGDKFCPSGMNGKSKKVSKFIKDLKIPNIKKSGIFVLISNDGNICGIPGYRADERYLPEDNEMEVLVIEVVHV